MMTGFRVFEIEIMLGHTTGNAGQAGLGPEL